MAAERANYSGKGGRRVAGRAVAAFLVSAAVCSVLLVIAVAQKTALEKLTMERLIVEKSIKITEIISGLIYKTQAVSALVIQNDGRVEDFERVAATLSDDPAILNILVAPGGVVSSVYPAAANREVVGYNLLGSGQGNREAIRAKEIGQLVFGGPFNLVQGGKALVGRLPVWLPAGDGGKTFWGLVSVTLKYPEALYGAGLDTLEKHGFAYEIWRTNPDSNEKQIIARSETRYSPSTAFIEKAVPIFNAEWYFRIMPVRHWYEHGENWILIFGCLSLSLLIGVVVQSNSELMSVKYELEAMVHTDSLTGLLNRKGLFSELRGLFGRAEEFTLHFIDLNDFKRLNDQYGHSRGDFALIEFSRRIGKHLGKEQIFARISGDEFILVDTEKHEDDPDGDARWRTIEAEFDAPLFFVGGAPVTLSFSRGVAHYPRDGMDVDELIIIADRNMYGQKRGHPVSNRSGPRG